jgi:hypothetical protein
MGHPMMAVDPEQLRAVGTAVGRTAETIRAAHAARAGALTPTGNAATGWATAGAAAAADSAWATYVTGLADAVAQHGSMVLASADGYRTTDGNNRDAMESTLPTVPGF